MTFPADFSVPERIITYAMRDANLLRATDLPTSDQLAEFSNRLNEMIMLWSTQGLKLWTQSDLSITLTAGTQAYSLGPAAAFITVKPYRVLQGYYLDVNNNRRPIYPLSWDEWLRLSQVSQTGQITQYFVDKQQVNLVVRFWLTPDSVAATGTAHLLIQQQVTQFTELDETINLPKEMFMAVRWGLADEICSGQPQAIMDRCQTRALAYRKMVEDWDVEDASTKFQPDTGQAAGYSNRGFV